MSSFENVEIFEDTKNLCEKNGRIKESLAKSVKNQKTSFPFISETRGYKGENWFSFYFRNIRLSEKYPLAI